MTNNSRRPYPRTEQDSDHFPSFDDELSVRQCLTIIVGVTICLGIAFLVINPHGIGWVVLSFGLAPVFWTYRSGLYSVFVAPLVRAARGLPASIATTTTRSKRALDDTSRKITMNDKPEHPRHTHGNPPRSNDPVNDSRGESRDKIVLALLRMRRLHDAVAKAKQDELNLPGYAERSSKLGCATAVGTFLLVVVILAGIINGLGKMEPGLREMEPSPIPGFVGIAAGIAVYIVVRRSLHAAAVKAFARATCKAEAEMRMAAEDSQRHVPVWCREHGGIEMLLDPDRLYDALSLVQVDNSSPLDGLRNRANLYEQAIKAFLREAPPKYQPPPASEVPRVSRASPQGAEGARQRSRALNDAALKLLERGELIEAIESWSEAMTTDPSHAAPCLNFAMFLLSQNTCRASQIDGAERLLLKAGRLCQGSADGEDDRVRDKLPFALALAKARRVRAGMRLQFYRDGRWVDGTTVESRPWYEVDSGQTFAGPPEIHLDDGSVLQPPWRAYAESLMLGELLFLTPLAGSQL